jgi:phenylacetate-CoA ligase
MYLWGSERDIVGGTEKWSSTLITRLTNTTFFNAYRMSPTTLMMLHKLMAQKNPHLIVAYVESIYEAAIFFDHNRLQPPSPKAVITSAGTLFPAMREMIKRVFQCDVFNYYGSRECGAIACELPGMQGLWVAPWGNYLEVVDEKGNSLPPQSHGEILITSLSNYVMPLIRYRIGDIGALDLMDEQFPQILLTLSGRINQHFKMRDGSLVNPGFFEFLLYFKPWIRKFQVVQKDYSSLLFRFMTTDKPIPEDDLAEIRQNVQSLMGEDCQITFEFVDELPPTPSGKFLYMYSEVHNAE